MKSVLEESDSHVVQGFIQCTHLECNAEFPILDGVPILLRDVQRYVSENIQSIVHRSDLHPNMESLLGDCCGQGSLFDTIRQHLSCYAWDHYGDWITPEIYSDSEPAIESIELGNPGSIRSLLNASMNLADSAICGPVLDIGCACGRTTFELAHTKEHGVLGVDLNWSMLRMASEILRTGTSRFPLRHMGVVYQNTAITAPGLPVNPVDFWAVDILEPPFATAQFAECFGFNVLDAVRSPVHLLELTQLLLHAGGIARLSCPYDWSIAATPAIGWIGGHSQRGEHRGDGPSLLRSWLDSKGSSFYSIVAELPNYPWTLRLHSRSEIRYLAHLFCLQKMTNNEPSSAPNHC
ncbi:hypothetical protein SH501x_003646 [Pirellulaceae bacterium SH501]